MMEQPPFFAGGGAAAAASATAAALAGVLRVERGGDAYSFSISLVASGDASAAAAAASLRLEAGVLAAFLADGGGVLASALRLATLPGVRAVAAGAVSNADGGRLRKRS